MAKVEELGLVVKTDPNHSGWFAVSTWRSDQGSGVKMTAYYDRLSYTEAVDVALALIDENRPGSIIEKWGVQDMLW